MSSYQVKRFSKIPYRILPWTKENIDRYKSPDNLLKHARPGDSGIFLVTPGKRELIGYVAWEGDYCTALEVSKKFRGKGYGSELLKLAIDSGVRVLSVNKNNRPAINLYEKAGFKKVSDLTNTQIEMKNFSNITRNYSKYHSWVACHEAGHFIFRIRGLIRDLGKNGAINYLKNNPMAVLIDGFENPQIFLRNSRSIARLIYDQEEYHRKYKVSLLTSFEGAAGGLAVDSVTKRCFRGTPVIKLVETIDLPKYESIIKESPEKFLEVAHGSDSKGLTRCLLQMGEYKGPEDTIKRIKDLGKSITKKEWEVIFKIADIVEENLTDYNELIIVVNNLALKYLLSCPIEGPEYSLYEGFTKSNLDKAKIRYKYFSILDTLAGRKVLYHGTSDSGAIGIKENGLRYSFYKDPSNNTLRKLEKHKSGTLRPELEKLMDWDPEHYKDLVYMTSDRGSAEFMAAHNKKKGRGGQVLEISLPYEFHRTLKPVSNPEYQQAAHIHTEDEMSRYLFGKPFRELSGPEKKNIKSFMKAKNGDFIVKGQDIPSKYIKGSKDYQGPGLKEIWNYLIK